MRNKEPAWRLVAVLLLAASLITFMLASIRAFAAPAFIPTPVSNPSTRIEPRYPINFMKEKVISIDGRGTTYSLPDYSVLDVQYVVDQGTTPNTLTLKMQYSNDGVNWVNGSDLVAGSATDTIDLVQLNNYGYYTNVYADVTNTQTVTVTVIAVGK